MASAHLSARTRQPGHDRSFTRSEQACADACRQLLPASFTLTEQPRDLADLYGINPDTGRALGVVPELKLTNTATGRYLYLEVKKQGRYGNAEERAAKHYTAPFIAAVAARSGLDYHPFATVFCDALATDGRYTAKLPFLVPDGHRLLWAGYQTQLLHDFLTAWRSAHLG